MLRLMCTLRLSPNFRGLNAKNETKARPCYFEPESDDTQIAVAYTPGKAYTDFRIHYAGIPTVRQSGRTIRKLSQRLKSAT